MDQKVVGKVDIVIFEGVFSYAYRLWFQAEDSFKLWIQIDNYISSMLEDGYVLCSMKFELIN